MQAHSSVRKACMVAVTPHVRVLPTCHGTGFSMEPALLEVAIKEDLAAGEHDPACDLRRTWINTYS